MVYISTLSLFKWPKKNPLLVFSTAVGWKLVIRAHRVDDGKMVRLFKSLEAEAAACDRDKKVSALPKGESSSAGRQVVR